ncbi:MAG: phenazine biosynthesis PhzC/PhzF protein [Flammeovirgaceae bacterium]|nr:phenazine biosynthesis PhzC/PhzF protein [Flammeovirgaceae bacterium]MBE62879.1 phenazine biosynthesis PhzC/PhzF protein [Flammeovirgaceae bacterium]HCX21629.1 PhzF family phenazine biosynthesis protein [Cytophagales bacterium]
MREFDFETYRVFTNLKEQCFGNTSSVVFLHSPMEVSRMKRIAADFWQPATTFLWKEAGSWKVRWFAPDEEIQLCGHGSLAAVAFIHDNFEPADEIILHATKTKIKGGKYNDNKCYIELDGFDVVRELDIPATLKEALGIPVLAFYETGNKSIVLTDTEQSVANMKPNFQLLRTMETFGYVVTAPSNNEELDFVSRTLVPHVHQLEDPATGSSHAALVPFWSKKLGKKHLKSRQLSQRGGSFCADYLGKKVKLYGAYQKLNKGAICSF